MAIDFAGTKRIYSRFQPDVPPAHGEYVDFNGLRGDPVIEPLAAEIAFADHPLTRLFSGGRGVGKTTELDKLKTLFEGKGFTVVSMDADRSIDVNNADFPDVLVFMALHLIQELDEQRSLAPFANALRAARAKLGETLRTINPTVDPKSVELSAGVAKIAFNLRQRRTGEESLREQAEALTNDTLQAFRELVGALKKAVESRGGAGLVLILDGTDKILPPVEGEADHQERLFVHRAAQLCDLGAPLILAAPISFCYSPKIAGFNQTAGGQPAILPTICLRDPETGNDAGYRKFVEVVEKRTRAAGYEKGEVFEEEALERIILASGGSPTMLMTLVRGMLSRAREGFPASLEVAEEAIRTEKNGFFRQLDQDHYKVLKEYLVPNPVRPDDALGLQCLFYTYLYEYVARSGGRKPWFEVNPIVRELDALRG